MSFEPRQSLRSARERWLCFVRSASSGFRSIAWFHRLWFVGVFLCSLSFLILIPPFQTNDEPSHWRRAWSTATGHLTCGAIPWVVDITVDAANYAGVRDRRQKFRFSAWDAMRQLTGVNKSRQAHGNACVYIPVAYLLPAAAMIPVSNAYDSRAGAGMLEAFYAARAANWLLMAAAVLGFLIWAPRLRNLTLVLYSLPTAMQQTVSINQESTIFLCMFVLLWLWWRKPSLAQVVGLLAAVTVLSAMKAIYLVLLLFWVCALWRWRRAATVTRRRFLTVAALGGIPVVIQALWSHFVVSVSGSDYLPGWGVAPHDQVAYLAHNPLQFLLVMLRGHFDLFGRGHMDGGWPSVLGVLGWADFEIGARAYALLFVAVALAILADLSAEREQDDESAISPWIRYVVPAFSAYLTIPSVILAMYIVFTKVGAPRSIGVQGRYLLFPYFLMIALALDWGRRRVSASSIFTSYGARVRALVPGVCAVLCFIADYDALRAILAMYYSA